MKHKFLLKTMLLLSALIVGSGSAWGQATPYYTLEPANGSNNSYNGNCDVEIDGITWNITGNSTTQPWRIGGKSLTNVDRTVYSKTAMGAAISSIDLTVGAASSITVNSLTLIVARDDEFSDVIDEVEKDFEANSIITFEPTSGSSWATGAYYKFVFNVTVSGNSNKFVQFSQVDFYEYTGGSSDASSEVAFANETPSINFPATTTYTQAATTATGYTGTVTYEITDNTAGATLEGTTLTVTQEGSVTVKATAPAITGWTKTEATYTLTVNDTRSANGLAYATATQNVVVGEVLDAPTLTNPHSLPVTYSSLDETIATVDASGNVTGVAIGSTTIKATFDGDLSYKAGSVSYTINVTKAPFVIEDGVFDFVEAAASDENYGSGISTTKDGQYYESADATWTAGNVTMVTSGKYRWWNNGSTLRFYYDSTTSTGSSFTITAPTNNVITCVEITGGSNFNVSNGTLSATTNGVWTGASNSVTFTYAGTSGSSNVSKIEVTYGTTVPVTLNSYGYATFAANAPLDFSDDSEFSAWQITGVSGSAITFSQITGAVAAGTGVLLKGTESTPISIPVAASGSDISGTNKLVGTTANFEVENKGDFYGLSGQTFVKVNAGTVKAGKALLPKSVVEGAGVKAFTFVFEDDATGVETIENGQLTNDNEIYNLAGQRLQKMQKGINIVNGKKVLF